MKYKVEKRDPEGAALRFALDIVQALDRYYATEILQEKKRTESLIKFLIPNLMPGKLKVFVQNAFRFWEEDDKRSLACLEQRISKLAVEINESEKAREVTRRRNGLTGSKTLCHLLLLHN